MMLTEMTKRSELIVLEVDTDGHLFYRFPQIIPEKRRWLDPDRPRVAMPDAPQARVRAPEAVPDDAPLEDEASPDVARARRAESAYQRLIMASPSDG